MWDQHFNGIKILALWCLRNFAYFFCCLLILGPNCLQKLSADNKELSVKIDGFIRQS